MDYTAFMEQAQRRPPAREFTDRPVSRSDLVARLADISDYFAGLHNNLNCTKHIRVTHWGKLAYGLVIDGFLARETGRSMYVERGLVRLGGVLDQLRHHHGHWIFYPGLLNPANASNNAIDSGAVVDSVAEWCGRMSEHTPKDLLERARDACVKVAESYLPNTLDKPTNQALWAMTGLASAWHFIEARPQWREVCLSCLHSSFADQCGDGSFPYLPERLRGVDHPSLYEASSYYHSRHVVFMTHVARLVNYTFTDEQRAALAGAGDFLAALYGPDGRKNLEVEAKHWYWMVPGRFETASASFDLHAFASVADLVAGDTAVRGAAWAARNFVESKAPDGSTANLGGPLEFQCTHFWTAHSAWVVRALERGFTPAPPSKLPPGIFDGQQSGVVTVTTDDWHVQLRSRRTPLSPLFGSYAAGAVQGLFHLGGRSDVNLLERDRFSFQAPGELFYTGGGTSLWRFHQAARSLWRDRRDYRFTLALVRDAVRVGAISRALGVLYTVVMRYGRFINGAVHSSFWPLTSSIDIDGSVIRVASALTRADGSSWIETPVNKTYRLEPDRVHVELESKIVRRSGQLRWCPPLTIADLEIEGASQRRRAGAILLFMTREQLNLRCSVLPCRH